MPSFVKVAQVSEIPPGGSKAVNVGAVALSLWNVGGALYATSNVCVHRGGPLSEGFLEGPVATCPWHGWMFDVTDGRCQTNPMAAIPCYPVKVEGEDILVEV